MSSTAKQDTVWMGFMDIVPVIGTVKESVELVLALYEGNKAVVKEKEKALENIVKESLKKHVKLTPAPPAPAANAGEYSGLGNVREVTKERIIEYRQKGSKRATKPTQAEKSQRQKKVEDIKKGMLDKIHIVDPDYNVELKEELERSKRGEHVFNKDIITYHSKVLTQFIQNKRIDKQERYLEKKPELDAIGRHTLSQNTAKEIETNMVVHFGEDEFYVNANGVVYGIYCKALREALLVVLGRKKPDKVTEQDKQGVNFVIDNMNNLEIYVDQLAKVSWIVNSVDKQNRFTQVKQEAVQMYKTHRGVDWCTKVLSLVKPLFEPQQ